MNQRDALRGSIRASESVDDTRPWWRDSLTPEVRERLEKAERERVLTPKRGGRSK